jgi:hypothetical protein
MDDQAATGPAYGAQRRVGCVLCGGAPCSLQAAFLPMMFCGGSSYLLKMWFLDRMTLYHEQEEPAEETEVATALHSS